MDRDLLNRQSQNLRPVSVSAQRRRGPRLLEMLTRRHVRDIHPKRRFNMHPNNALQTMRGAM